MAFVMGTNFVYDFTFHTRIPCLVMSSLSSGTKARFSGTYISPALECNNAKKCQSLSGQTHRTQNRRCNTLSKVIQTSVSDKHWDKLPIHTLGQAKNRNDENRLLVVPEVCFWFETQC